MNKTRFFYILLALSFFFLFTRCSKEEGDLLPNTKARVLKPEPTYVYPYKDLCAGLLAKNVHSLRLFVYGSLMDPDSRKTTLTSSEVAPSSLSLAFGVQRLFNLDVPYKEGSKWGPLSTDSSRGMLNLKITGNPDEFINGVIIDVKIEDLAALSEREERYNLVPVLVADWQAFLHGKLVFSTAYTLIAPDKTGITSSTILPRNGYMEFARQAARAYGTCFEDFWLNTTYLADGVTPLAEWPATNR